jgi:RNase P subunit RPR2
MGCPVKKEVVRWSYPEEEGGSRKPMDEQALRQMSLEILTDLKKWRRAHPRATYVQIEDEVHKRLMQLEARLIESAVEQSQSREWGRGSEREAVLCSKCATPLQARGKQKRTFQGNGGENVTLSRTYGTCPKCGESLFPPG